MAKKVLKKTQSGGSTKPTKDSTKYFKDESKFNTDLALLHAKFGHRKRADDKMAEAKQNLKDASRQYFKGKPGYDANGYPKKKSGGVIKSKTKK